AVGAAAPQEGLESTDEFHERERLGEVVVAAGVKAGNAVDERVPGGQEKNRSLDPPRPECLAEVAPVGVRQSDVDDQDVRRCSLDLRERASPAGCQRDDKSLLTKPTIEHTAQALVVLDDKDSLAEARAHPGSVAAPAGQAAACSFAVTVVTG